MREVIAKGQFALPIERANFWTALRDISRFVSKEGVVDDGGGSATDGLSPAARRRMGLEDTTGPPGLQLQQKGRRWSLVRAGLAEGSRKPSVAQRMGSLSQLNLGSLGAATRKCSARSVDSLGREQTVLRFMDPEEVEAAKQGSFKQGVLHAGLAGLSSRLSSRVSGASSKMSSR